MIDITFILSGLLGLIPNPIVALDGIFAVNTAHNLVHVLTGIAFLAGAWLGRGRATVFGIGVAYVGGTILGFLTSGDAVLGLIDIKTADHWLHAALAASSSPAGYSSPTHIRVRHRRRQPVKFAAVTDGPSRLYPVAGPPDLNSVRTSMVRQELPQIALKRVYAAVEGSTVSGFW